MEIEDREGPARSVPYAGGLAEATVEQQRRFHTGMLDALVALHRVDVDRHDLAARLVGDPAARDAVGVGGAAARSTNALAGRIKLASFPLVKELADFDFALAPTVSKPKVLELARCQWIDQHHTAGLIGNSGTGKTHLAVAIGLSACRAGKRVKFTTAATLANQLEEAQKQYRLERTLKQLEKVDLLVIDELGYLSFSRTAAELLFDRIGGSTRPPEVRLVPTTLIRRGSGEISPTLV